MGSEGFLGWAYTEGTFTRGEFHHMFVEHILPHLGRWPHRNSIVIIDNARIHMYAQLEEAIHARGAALIYLPPYCPHLNPIEVGFSLVKRWIQKHASKLFGQQPREVLTAAFRQCASRDGLAVNLFNHCGYYEKQLDFEFIQDDS